MADDQHIAGKDFAGGMMMWRSYINVLAFALGLSNFAVLVLGTNNEHGPALRDLALPSAVVMLVVSLAFVIVKMVRVHDARIIARALAQRDAQIASFKSALRNPAASTPNFSKGMGTWNS